MAALWLDVRFCVRMLLKAPTFAIVTVLTLGLGIGATTAIFSVVNGVVLRPLPYPRSDEIVQLHTQFPRQQIEKFRFSEPEYYDLVRDARWFRSLAAYIPAGAAISTRDRPIRALATYSTVGLAETLGVAPALGRWFSADEDAPAPGPTHNIKNVVVISDRLWKTAFAGDPGIVGRHVILDALPATIIGVMAEGFAYPSVDTDLYIPLGLDPAATTRGDHKAFVIGRLAAGVAIAQARAELATLMDGWKAHPADARHALGGPDHPVIVVSLKDEVIGSVRTALWVLQAAVFFVLLIACANIANLLLARAESRSREIAIRNALGADRGRLIRQFLTESLVIGAFGAVVGSVLAAWGVDATVALLPATAPRASEIRVDGWVFAFAGVAAIGSSLLFGMAPIFHTRIQRLSDALRDGQRIAGSPRQRLRRALVVAEVALAVVLLIGCGLMTQSFVRLTRVDLGFTASALSTGQLEIASSAYAEDGPARGYWLRLQDRLRALPGVTGASVMSGLPPARRLQSNGIELVGKARSPSGPEWNVDFIQVVGDDFFETMKMRLVAGRFLRPGDDEAGAQVAVINEAFARTFFPGEDPLGKQVSVAPGASGSPRQTIVGVVGDTKQQGLDAPPGTEIYVSLRQAQAASAYVPHNMHLVVRSGVAPSALFGSIRALVSDLDASVPLYRLRTFDDILGDEVARPRFVTFLLGVFAGLALLLAAVGIYGVMAYTVEQRRRELGIRMALGAQVAGLRRLVLRDGFTLAAVGVALGLAVAYVLNTALGQGLATLLYDVRAVDPGTFSGVAVVVLAVASLACAIPAFRATRVDPMVALR